MPFITDLIGIHDVQANGGLPVVRRSVLNIVGTGVSVTDNPLTQTTDVFVPSTVGGLTITTAAIAANMNDYAPANGEKASVQRWSATTNVNVTGLVWVDGVSNPRPVIMNVGSPGITLIHQSSSSLAANRFVCPGGSSFSLLGGGVVELARDTVSNVWRVVG